jgi:hypothetical protein
MGSLSGARTSETHSWTQRKGSWRTNDSSSSIPREDSRSAREHLALREHQLLVGGGLLWLFQIFGLSLQHFLDEWILDYLGKRRVLPRGSKILVSGIARQL